MASPSPHPNAATLRAVYADLSRIAEHADVDIVLHTADRALQTQAVPVHGREAVQAHELELIRLTGGTLVMDVEHIVANDHFGAVLGVLRSTGTTEDVAMPFCGLWRFRDGRIVEHWENAYDPASLGQLLSGIVQ